MYILFHSLVGSIVARGKYLVLMLLLSPASVLARLGGEDVKDRKGVEKVSFDSFVKVIPMVGM